MPANCLKTARTSSSGEDKLPKVQPLICTEPKPLPQLGDGRFQQQRSTAQGRQGLSDKPLATPNAAGVEGNQQVLAREKIQSTWMTGCGMEMSKKAGQEDPELQSSWFLQQPGMAPALETRRKRTRGKNLVEQGNVGSPGAGVKTRGWWAASPGGPQAAGPSAGWSPPLGTGQLKRRRDEENNHRGILSVLVFIACLAEILY